MEQNESLEKANVIRFLLETEGRVMLCIDATQKDVDVPRRFANDPGLMLVLNGQMPQPINILSDSITSELRFGGIPHHCVIPYTALWSAFNPDSNHGVTWTDAIPESVRHTHDALLIPIKKVRLDPAKKAGSFLRVIEGGSGNVPPNTSDTPDTSDTSADTSSTKSRRSHLRLVE